MSRTKKRNAEAMIMTAWGVSAEEEGQGVNMPQMEDVSLNEFSMVGISFYHPKTSSLMEDRQTKRSTSRQALPSTGLSSPLILISAHTSVPSHLVPLTHHFSSPFISVCVFRERDFVCYDRKQWCTPELIANNNKLRKNAIIGSWGAVFSGSVMHWSVLGKNPVASNVFIRLL